MNRKIFDLVTEDHREAISLKFGMSVLKKSVNSLQNQFYVTRANVLQINITFFYRNGMKQLYICSEN